MKIVSNGKTIEIASRAELTSGDGITIEGNTISVTTPVKGVTQAEYDGIPEEERKGLFVITDANTAFPEGGEVYSTEETRIGTWINGKPLYQKTFAGTTPANNYTAVFADVSDLLIETFVSGEGVCDSDLEVGTVSIPDSRMNGNVISLGISQDKTEIKIYASGDVFHSKSIYYTIRYTKTTDSEVSA